MTFTPEQQKELSTILKVNIFIICTIENHVNKKVTQHATSTLKIKVKRNIRKFIWRGVSVQPNRVVVSLKLTLKSLFHRTPFDNQLEDAYNQLQRN